MNQEKNKNKKKIVAISLFSALILGGVATTAYLMTKPSMNDQPQYLSSSESRNGSNVEFLDPSIRKIKKRIKQATLYPLVMIKKNQQANL